MPSQLSIYLHPRPSWCCYWAPWCRNPLQFQAPVSFLEQGCRETTWLLLLLLNLLLLPLLCPYAGSLRHQAPLCDPTGHPVLVLPATDNDPEKVQEMGRQLSSAWEPGAPLARACRSVRLVSQADKPQHHQRVQGTLEMPRGPHSQRLWCARTTSVTTRPREDRAPVAPAKRDDLVSIKLCPAAAESYPRQSSYSARTLTCLPQHANEHTYSDL
ncbi:hypothetical protein KCU83_g629, partial [Aureobasidium melanogenum]